MNRIDGRYGRFYEIEDLGELPSVTTILSVISKPALVNWAAKVEREMVLEVSADLYLDTSGIAKAMSRTGWITTMQSRLGKAKAAQKELAKASEIGTQTHALIEWNLRKLMGQEPGPEPRITDKALWAFMAWEDWAKTVNLKPLMIEAVVWSEKYGYAGMMDLLAEVNGKPTVIDWKTGKAVYPEAHLQNVAYRRALCEMKHAKNPRGIIVRLPKVETDPNFEAVEVINEKELFKAFLAAQKLWAWQYQNEQARLRSQEIGSSPPARANNSAEPPATAAAATTGGAATPTPAPLPSDREERVRGGNYE